MNTQPPPTIPNPQPVALLRATPHPPSQPDPMTLSILGNAADDVRAASASRLTQTVNYQFTPGILNANLQAAYKKRQNQRAASDSVALISRASSATQKALKLSIIMKFSIRVTGKDTTLKEVSVHSSHYRATQTKSILLFAKALRPSIRKSPSVSPVSSADRYS